MSGDSPRWHRVAALRPRLPRQLCVRRQRVRGETWFLLADTGARRSVRLNAAAYDIAARLDGRRSVQAVWEQLLEGRREPPTQEEVVDLLARLDVAGLLRFDGAAPRLRLDPGETPAPGEEGVDGATARAPRSLLAWRLRLADPTRLLDRLAPLQRVFSPAGAVLWLAAVAALLVLAAQHGPELVAHGREWLATPRYVLLALLAYLPLKLVHELAHGLAVRRWGGTVHDAGVTLVMGLPLPWMDASASTLFVRRRQRILVAAAGMMAELAVAAVVLPLWLWLPDGPGRDLAFVLLFVAGVSTLVFNANPLQRLDGYHIATELLALPNLATRSRAWWLAQLRRHLLRREKEAEALRPAPGEAPWLAAYAPLSWLYGLAIVAWTVLWLGSVSLPLGVGSAVLLGWQMALRPFVALLGRLRLAAQARQSSARRWRRLALGSAAALLVLLAVPLPQHALVQGVVWPPEQAQLRADEAGFVRELRVADGTEVPAGTVVLRLENPALQTQLERQDWRIAALEAELVQSLPGDGALPVPGAPERRSGDLQAELAAARHAQARLRERIAALDVRSRSAGRVALLQPQAGDLAGRWLAQGALVGQVLGGAPPTVRVALPESEADALAEAQPEAGVRLAAAPGRAHDARLVRDSLGAVARLPSAALSERHGGPVPTDPKDGDDLVPLRPVVLLDVQLDRPPAAGTARLGERAWVRLDLGFAPLGWRALQAFWRGWSQRLNPQF